MVQDTEYNREGLDGYNVLMGLGFVHTEYGNLSRAAFANFRDERFALDFLIDVQDYLIVSLSGNPKPHLRTLLYRRARRAHITPVLDKFMTTVQAFRSIAQNGPTNKAECEASESRAVYPF